ncbi:MAG: NnrS family protein [Lysobacterales bacterium]|nr:MAG: NnrS family protein [Xanthomonadales bacterium]
MGSPHPLWSRGFRPFFLGAGLFAIATMIVWLAAYRFGLAPDLAGITLFQWHAHEMVYGYAMAVIAGFLLTAAQNWTGVDTLHGPGLAGLLLLWLAARVMMLTGTAWLLPAAAADLAFAVVLFIAIARPVLKVRQRRQTPVLLVLALLAAGNAAFYLGALAGAPEWVARGVYGGFYLVLGMVLFMGRRVIPFFAERGVGYEVELRNSRWNDVASFVFYALFLVAEVLAPGSLAGSLVAALLFVLNGLRLAGWHTPGIWRRPLLWSLYLAYAAIALGFLARALVATGTLSPLLAVHTFALGGVGLITLSMMTRVALGHTGRNVHQPPAVAALFLGLLIAAGLSRTLGVASDPGHYALWITLSGALWIAAFGLFAASVGPLLWRPRPDGA